MVAQPPALPPLTVHFTDESTGSITWWEWDFDNDGIAYSSDPCPPCTYEAPGRYTVSLKVTGPGGSDTKVNSNYITVRERAGCFIATAAYGTPMAEEIELLREFRDEYLLTNPVGKALVDFYYRVSPPIAEFIAEHPGLKPIVRAGLLPAVAMSTVAINTSPAEKTAIIGLLVLISVAVHIWMRKRRGRGPQYA